MMGDPRGPETGKLKSLTIENCKLEGGLIT
jgi:hypothetical protein